jgi:tetratricopeptide (TPR) repeat protein
MPHVPLTSKARKQQRSRPKTVPANSPSGHWPWQNGGSAVLLVVIVGLAAYANSFSAAFVFDGAQMLRDLPALRDIRLAAFSSMRPVALLSFYVNHQLHGTDVFGYHLVNLAIHIAAAVVLMKVVRRTLLRAPAAEARAGRALPLALSVALLWMVHPLQTQSVTYIYQRYESLMGLFVLLSVYCFIRAVDGSRPRWWYAASVACWLLGLGSKEVAMIVPAILLWYDRALVASSWRELLRRRWAYYGLLGAVVTGGALVIWIERRWYAGGGILALDQVSPWQYARSQPGVVMHYLRLVFWPQGQCTDYGWPVAATTAEILGPLVPLLVVLCLTAWCALRQPAWGFVGGWFFLMLLPTSSFAPIIDLAFEHRMYLALAAVVAMIVVGADGLLQHWARFQAMPMALRRNICVGLVAATVVALGATTFARNTVYRDEISFWSDVIGKFPRNARARSGLAAALNGAHRHKEAAEQARVAIQLSPDYLLGYKNLGLAYTELGQTDLAMAAFREAVRVDPRSVESHYHLGNLLRSSDPEAAIAHYRAALLGRPGFLEAHANLANLLQTRSPAEAEKHYRAALEIDPTCVAIHRNLGSLLTREQRFAEAMAQYQMVLNMQPDDSRARQSVQMVERMLKR